MIHFHFEPHNSIFHIAPLQATTIIFYYNKKKKLITNCLLNTKETGMFFQWKRSRKYRFGVQMYEVPVPEKYTQEKQQSICVLWLPTSVHCRQTPGEADMSASLRTQVFMSAVKHQPRFVLCVSSWMLYVRTLVQHVWLRSCDLQLLPFLASTTSTHFAGPVLPPGG